MRAVLQQACRIWTDQATFKTAQVRLSLITLGYSSPEVWGVLNIGRICLDNLTLVVLYRIHTTSYFVLLVCRIKQSFINTSCSQTRGNGDPMHGVCFPDNIPRAWEQQRRRKRSGWKECGHEGKSLKQRVTSVEDLIIQDVPKNRIPIFKLIYF